MVRKFSYQTQLVELHKKKLSFKESCFIRIPTKDQGELKNLSIVVAIQAPEFVGNFDGLASLNLNQVLERTDKILFRTCYMCEIPLYDWQTNSIIKSEWLKEPTIYKFPHQHNYQVTSDMPYKSFDKSKSIILDMSVTVLSQTFTNEPHLNFIITQMEKMKSNPLNALDIKNILHETKQIHKPTLVFYVEKLLTMLLEIFSKVQTVQSSNDIFEAILYVINLFKSKKEGKDKEGAKYAYIINEYIKKTFKNNQANHVYVKILFQMMQFADKLEESIDTGQMCPPLKEHFTIFKHMPTVMAILFRSYEQEQRNSKRGTIVKKKEKDRQTTVIEYNDTDHLPDYGKSRQNDISRISHHSQMLSPSASLDTSPLKFGGKNPQSKESEDMASVKIESSDETKMDIQNLIRGVEGRPSAINDSVMHVIETNDEMVDLGVSFTNAKEIYSQSKVGQIGEENDSDFIESSDDEKDMFSNMNDIQSTRQTLKEEYPQDSGMKQKREKHPLRSLTMVDNNIVSKERLLHMTSLTRIDFRRVMQITLEKIARLIHTDHNNSCKQLRMLFYQNFSEILEDVIVYLDQEFLMCLINYLVTPLRSKNGDLLDQTQLRQNEQTNRRSNRMSQSLQLGSLLDKGSLKKMISEPQVNQSVIGPEPLNISSNMMGSVMMHDYVSEKMFWVNELIGNDKIKLSEYVQRVITMGRFLESKAIDKIPNNPLIGRRISYEFSKFVSECVTDQSAQNHMHAKFMENVAPTMKAHTLLYILHQLFKHENRFGQIYDQNENMIRPNDAALAQAAVDNQQLRMRTQMGLDVIKEEPDVNIGDDGDQVDNFETKDSGLNDRLDLFIGDVDLYTSMLTQLEKTEGDEQMPDELRRVLDPVKEKTQLIIFQLISLFNKKNLSNFIERKKQLKQLLQNMIQMLISESLEFRPPYTKFGQEKKLKVFARFTSSLSDVLKQKKNQTIILARKEIFRPIMCSLWLMQLFTLSKLLQNMYIQGAVKTSHEVYEHNTWYLFKQFTEFWMLFRNKRGVLLLTSETKNTYDDLIRGLVSRAVEEVKVEMFETLNITIQVILLNEEEVFMHKSGKVSSTDTDILTQLVLLCKQILSSSQKYQNQCVNVESDPYFETLFYRILQQQITFIKVSSHKARLQEEFSTYLDMILEKFKQIEKRMLLVVRSRKLGDPLYEAFCEYEQLKIFLQMNLTYGKTLFKQPFVDYKKLLTRMKSKMICPDDVKEKLEKPDDNIKLRTDHLRTEVAFTKVREHELVEAKVKEGKIKLGSDKIDVDVRVQLIEDACTDLRECRFYLKAIELKEKEKNLLIQTFEYGSTNQSLYCTDPDCQQVKLKQQVKLVPHCPACKKQNDKVQLSSLDAHLVISSNIGNNSVFQTLGDEVKIHQDILTKSQKVKNFATYFLMQFVGSSVPLEMKAEGGFVIRGLDSATWFQITEDLQGLYKSLGKKIKPKPLSKIIGEYKTGLAEAKLEDYEQQIQMKKRARTNTEEQDAEKYAEKMAEQMQSNPSKFESLIVAYDWDMIKFIDDDKPNPPENEPGIHARIMKIKPFSNHQRKRFQIDNPLCENYGEISETIDEQTSRFGAQFKQYFAQNYKNQFYFKQRDCNQYLKMDFLEEINIILEDEDEQVFTPPLAKGFLSKSQIREFFEEMSDKLYGKNGPYDDDFKDFWKKQQLEKKLNEDQMITTDDILNAAGDDWQQSKVQLHDVKITVYEVEENFPTMYFMQKIIKKKVTKIYGVEKEMMTWEGRINKHIKIRREVSQSYALIQRPPAPDTSSGITHVDRTNYEKAMTQFYLAVGPNLKTFWETIRTDVDADEKGGVMTTVGIFFPNEYTLTRIKDAKRKRLTLDLFVVLETYLTEVHTSLQSFEKYNRDYDEFCLRRNSKQSLVRDNVVNWYSQFNSIRNAFDMVRKKCKIDKMLLDQEDEYEEEEEADPNAQTHIYI